MTGFLSVSQRDVLELLARTLIPESDEGPSASEARVADVWIDEIITERPDLVDQFERTLAAFDSTLDPRSYLERMEQEAAVEFAQFTYMVAAAYFRSPVVQKWLGSGRVLDEYEGAEQEPTAATLELLRPVQGMTPFYRPTNGEIGVDA